MKNPDGGADVIRTRDLLVANETLCQLSYDPIRFRRKNLRRIHQRARTRDTPIVSVAALTKPTALIMEQK